MPGQRRQKPKSEYGLQLQDKQKLRDAYLLRERQFRNYFKSAKNPASIFNALETRLDSIVYRLGFAATRGLARQLVSHGHIKVNGRVVDIPSCQVRERDIVSIHPSSLKKGIFSELDDRLKKYQAPSWVQLDKQKKEGGVKGQVPLEEVGMEFNIQSVIEFYNR